MRHPRNSKPASVSSSRRRSPFGKHAQGHTQSPATPKANKALGQHFLLDSQLNNVIAATRSPQHNGVILEVGPGTGALTHALLEHHTTRIVAVEPDARMWPSLMALRQRHQQRLVVVHGQAQHLSLNALALPITIYGNLPFYIATELLTYWLCSRAWASPDTSDASGASNAPYAPNRHDQALSSSLNLPYSHSDSEPSALPLAPSNKHHTWNAMVLMFQHEVALRVTAPVGSHDYGRLSVLAQSLSRPTITQTIQARQFSPPPKVDASVVLFEPIPNGSAPHPTTLKHLEQLTAFAFHQRRKTLRKSLQDLLGDSVIPILESQGIDPGWRAQNVPPQVYLQLAQQLMDTRHFQNLSTRPGQPNQRRLKFPSSTPTSDAL